ncbi:tetratricopeptide repeat protein [Paraburkholderia acidisoli]|uniref:Tetratricopeptide repeat protein n=1 Tax=Paraburkholderia acidisoli TaxID=2571748 RepID=A0A7Z2JL25_9BURK|nr:tetratricopeptide repeat protein [Paraburkholderia acidisoli]QGZ66924.1 tetratricopeptide repeat protein [Paraburkholderia acidisoli]
MSVGGYSLRDVQRMLGVSRGVIERLIAAGFVTPAGGGRARRFSYRDVVMLRTAHSLRVAGIAPRRIVRALEALRRRWLREGGPGDLTAARLTAVGNHVAVRAHDATLLAETGQLLLDLEPRAAPGDVLDWSAASSLRQQDAALDAYREGERHEGEGDARAAQEAYRRALAVNPRHLDAALNLGYLLCDEGHCRQAVNVYRAVLASGADSPLLQFNLGVALEDAGDLRGALGAYNRCIDEQPDFADAHFNAARIHEVLGDTARAIRHFNRYRILDRGGE